jgi:HK97 family phage major capsid protein
MPWNIKENDGKYCVYKENEPEPLKCYDSKAEATDYLQALYASEEKAVKVGARNSHPDRGRIREIRKSANAIVNISRELEPDDEDKEPMPEWLGGKSLDDCVVTHGSEIKALGNGKIGGYLVRFSDASNPDLTGDYFTKDTDFDMDFPGQSTVYFNHGMDAKMGKRKLGKATLTMDEVGVWAEALEQERDEYEKYITKMQRAGKMGWSSGTASHLVERVREGKANRITRWPLGLDASITHTPAEPRNVVIPLKSLIEQPAVNFLQVVGQKTLPAGITTFSTTAGSSIKLLITATGEPEAHASAVSTADAEPKIQNLENHTEIKTMEANEIAGMVSKAVQDALAARDAEVAVKPAHEAELKAAVDEGYKKALEEMKTSSRKGGYTFHKTAELGFKDDAEAGFRHWMKTGQVNGALLIPGRDWEGQSIDEIKGAWEGGTANEGGYLVPDGFMPKITEKRDQYSWARNIGCTIINTSLDVVNWPTESTAQTKLTLVDEEANYSENEPVFGQVSTTIYKFTKLVKVSSELMEDNKANLDSYIASQFGRAWGLCDDYYFSIGTGSGDPQGVVVGSTANATTSGSTTFTAAELTDLVFSPHPEYAARGSWLMQPSTMGYIASLQASASAGVFLFNNFPAGSPAVGSTSSPNGNLLGKPVWYSGAMAEMGTGLKPIVFGDFSMYAIAQREGMVVARNPYLYQLSDQIGYFCKVRQGGAVLQAGAFYHMLMA